MTCLERQDVDDAIEIVAAEGLPRDAFAAVEDVFLELTGGELSPEDNAGTKRVVWAFLGLRVEDGRPAPRLDAEGCVLRPDGYEENPIAFVAQAVRLCVELADERGPSFEAVVARWACDMLRGARSGRLRRSPRKTGAVVTRVRHMLEVVAAPRTDANTRRA